MIVLYDHRTSSYTDELGLGRKHKAINTQYANKLLVITYVDLFSQVFCVFIILQVRVFYHAERN